VERGGRLTWIKPGERHLQHHYGINASGLEPAMPRALTIIRDEHRTIAAILHGMEYLVREVRARRKKVDPKVFHAMLYYLDTFAQRVHHPKEDKYLFGIMKQRSEEAAAVIAQLEEEHAAGDEALRRLAQAMIRFEEGGEIERPGFVREVEKFVEGYRSHMRKEEERLFPLALGILTPLDWVMIDAAMEEHTDPLAAAREERNFDKLFNRIVNIAPPPIGVGPAAGGVDASPAAARGKPRP
jgi:hemerythrin-like domain-containing protein